MYVSSGSILSIKDYNDDSLVKVCLTQGCFYRFEATLIRKEKGGVLYVDVSYTGAQGLSEEIIIEGLTVFY